MINYFINYLRFERRYSEHTIISYQTDLIQYQTFLEEKFNSTVLIQATHSHVRSWVISLMEEEMSPRSVNRKIATLRSFYKFLIKTEIIEKDPTLKVKILKTKKLLPNFVKEDEITRLFDGFMDASDFNSLRERLIIEIFYCTGIRLSELAGLKESDIDLTSRTLKVLGKRNKERIVPFPAPLVEVINNYISKKRAHFSGNNVPFLFVKDSGEQCYAMMIYRTVRKYLDIYTTLEKRSPHVLRHTYATHLLDNGADLNAVKELLGHSSLAATQVYTHNSLAKLKKVFEQAHPKA